MKEQSFTLTPLQVESINRMKDMQAAVLALSPGCGKTLCILSLVRDYLLKDNNDRCLFFIPKSARASFIKEMTTRMHEDFILIKAGKTYTYEDIENHRYIFIENTLVNKYSEILIKFASNYTCHLVIDEAHSLQNPESVFSKAAWEIRCYCKRIYAMTATPLLNSIEGLFNLYHFCFPKIFSSWFRFRARYCITQDHIIRMKNRFGKLIERKIVEIVGYQNMDELNSVLDKLTIKGCVHYNVNFDIMNCPLDDECEKLYKLASNGLFDILYHPEKVKNKQPIKKSADQLESISDSQKDFGARLHDLQRVVDFGDDQVGDGFISNKMKLILDAVKAIMSRNESTLIYFEYKDTLEYAERTLLKYQSELGFKNIYRLTGEEKEETRAKIEKELGLQEIILCSQAASQSRNLQRANNIIIANLPFSCGRLVQVLGRICRVDTTYDHQNVYILEVNKTIDEYKVELFKQNICLIKTLLGMESLGTLDKCTYLDVSSDDRKKLKNNLLWKR